jgi:uncharacterized membrane protein
MLEHEARAGGIYDRLGAILRTMMFIGMAIVAIGTIVSFAQHGELTIDVTHLDHIPRSLADGKSEAIISLGFIVLLCAPAAGLAYLSVAFFRVGNRTYSLFAFVILLIILASIALGRKA